MSHRSSSVISRISLGHGQGHGQGRSSMQSPTPRTSITPPCASPARVKRFKAHRPRTRPHKPALAFKPAHAPTPALAPTHTLAEEEYKPTAFTLTDEYCQYLHAYITIRHNAPETSSTVKEARFRNSIYLGMLQWINRNIILAGVDNRGEKPEHIDFFEYWVHQCAPLVSGV